MKRRFLSIILCLVMIIGTMPINIMAYNATDIQNDEIQTYADFGDSSPIGAGTKENPYLITSVSELEWFRDEVNGGNNNISARLMRDIDLDKADNWTAIGSSANPYTGTFDGNNYNIDTDLGKKWTMTSEDKSVLFGYIGNGGMIKSLNMWFQVIAVDNAAVLTYENNGTIEQCTVTTILDDKETESFCGFAYTNNGTIKNCLSILRGQYKNTCGFVHTNNGTIESSLCSFEETRPTMSEDTDSVYAIAKETTGTITNCYCTCTYHSGIVKDTGNVQKVYNGGDGLRYDSENGKAALLKKIAWLLNNNGSTEGSSTDPWRYGEDVNGANHYTPTLNPTDQKVLASDGSQTETPHTHRVDGVIREFVGGNIYRGGEYIYLEDDNSLVNELTVEENMTVCLNGHNLGIDTESIVVPSGINFTVTDCRETAGTVTSGGDAGVTVNGGTFVLDNASISSCAVGIDYKSGTVKLSGKARVNDNTANIKLAEGQKLSFGLLDERAHFGVKYDGNIDVGGEVEITDRTGAAYAQHLSSDNDEYLIADGSNAVVLKNPVAHSHCVCGAEHKEISGTDENGIKTGHTTEESVVFKPWNPNSHRDSENRPTLPTSEGSYYLTENADLKDGAWEPNGNVTLCLNGHTVTFDTIKDSSGHDIGTVWLDGAADNLTVTDCGQTGTITMSGEKQNCVRITKGGVFNLYGGTMKGFSRTVSIGDYSSLDLYRGYGTFNMYGGTLTENTYALGAAVYGNHKDAKVVMYGGKIINNKSALIGADTTQGGGVCVTGGGSFTMYNGEISGNGQADTTVAADKQVCTMFGGGVYVSGTFKMYGGKINDNTTAISGKTVASYGGGVCAVGTFNMYGGEISGNTVKKGYGGGVYIRNTGSSPCIKNATISRNKVEEHRIKSSEGGGGGGIYYYHPHHSADPTIPLTLENTVVFDNSLHINYGDDNKYGGGAGMFSKSDIIIDRCAIRGNIMTGKNGQTDSETSEPIGAIGGAGVCVPSANLTIKNSEIIDNKAITDDGTADNRKLVSGGVLFCDSAKAFTVSGKVKINGNTADGAEGNVYLEKRWNGSAEQTRQTTIWVGALDNASGIGVMARTAENGDVQVAQVNSEDGTIPTGVFTSDKDEYKAVLSNEQKYVTLTVNTDVAEVIHADGTKTGYDDIYNAIENAQNGETVKVIRDCPINNAGIQASLQKDITLDLNGKTVETNELIRITGNVTIKNGKIFGSAGATAQQNIGSALITFQPTGNAPTLTLDNVIIQKHEKSTLALYVYNGKLIAKGGSIDGGLRVNDFGDAELSDITIIKDQEHTVYEGNDGVIFDNKSDGGVARFLKTGYAYKKSDGTFVDISTNPTSIPIGTTVTVSECRAHSFDSGKCKYCGYVCKHETVKNWQCTDCRSDAVAMSDNNSAWYFSFDDAFAPAGVGQIKMIALRSGTHTLSNDILVRGDIRCNFINTSGSENIIKFNDNHSFVVEEGGFLGLGEKMHISAATVKAGGGFNLQPDAIVEHLILEKNCTIFIDSRLGQGNFGKIVIQGDNKIADIVQVALNKTFRHKGDDGTWATGDWATDEELESTSIENVSIVEKPFYNESITVSPNDKLTYKKALNVTMSAAKTDSGVDYGETTYEWFATHSPAVVLNTHSSYTTTLSVAGTYEFGCRITRGGYTRTVIKQITVNKGNSEYTTEPKAKENLVYDGSSQELIEAGTLSTDQKILYKLDDGDWSENIPKAKDAGVYKVYYKVEENSNYSGIAEKYFDVTIAKKVIGNIVIGAVSKQYDGKKDLPTGFGITKFKDPNGNEFDLFGCTVTGEYESAGAGENKKVTLTVNLRDLAKNYVFDNGTAEKTFEKTGTITKANAPYTNYKSLTIVKKLKRDYKFDLSTLLGDVPSGTTYGKVTYRLDVVDIPDFYDESNGKATIDEDGILTLPIQESIGTGDGTVTVLATTDNYKGSSGEDEITLTIEIVSMAKIVLKDGAPALNPTSITYGQKLGDISLSGSFEDYDGNIVEGIFSWTNPDTKPSAGAASGEWTFTPDQDEFYMYESKRGTVNFTVEPKDITNASVTIGDFNLEYNGRAQTPTAAVTVGGEVVDGVWSEVTNISEKTSFTANGNFKGTIENIATNMKPKKITNAVITLAESPEYNGSEQTQDITSITVGGLTLSESDYDIVSGNTATDAGEKTLKIQGKGNFSGNAEKKWSLKKKNYDGIKTASANVRYDKDMNITVELPEIPRGASYGTVTLSQAKNADGTDYEYSIFPSGQRGVVGNTLYITTVQSQPGVYAYITIPVINATNYNDYEITVRLNCVNRKTVTFGGIDDNQTFVYDGTAKAPASDGLTVSDNVDKNTLNVKYEKVTESGAADISANEITDVGTYKVTYSVPDTNDEFTGSVTYTFTIEPKSVNDALVILGESHKYNGSEQTQGITSITVGGLTLGESDYDISDNKATDVKTDGNYVLTITGKGNFNGTRTVDWNIKPTAPTESTEKKTTARVRRGKTLANATVTNGEFFGIDGTTVLDGTFAWVDNTKVMSANGTESMIFTPSNKNYAPITIDVAVSMYSSGGGGSPSSNTVYTVKFDTNGGSKVASQSVSQNSTVKEPTAPTKDGFKFAGWYLDKELKTKYAFSDKVTKSITLYAAWAKVETEPDPNPTDEPENPEKEILFDDVSKDDWYYDDVKSAVENGLFKGTGSKTFAPNDSVTREMFVTVLYRADGEPKVNTAIPFVDVSADSYYANALIWAEQNDIVNGVSETEFAPNEKITREQIAVIMFRYAKYKGVAPTGAWAIKLDYADLESISDYASEAVMYCTLKGIMQGKENNLFAPQDNATRAEIAAILNRFIEKNK